MIKKSKPTLKSKNTSGDSNLTGPKLFAIEFIVIILILLRGSKFNKNPMFYHLIIPIYSRA